jgi:hypothetical protein
VAYIPGDFWRICDACGFQYRSSQTRKRWDGAWVCDADWEPRHPQDFVRGRKDRQRVPEPRPEPADVFVSGAPDVVYTTDDEPVLAIDGDMVVI